MPMIDTGTGDLVQQLLALSKLIGEKKMRQGENLLGLALPGQTIGQVLPDRRQAERVLGKGYNPNQVIKPETMEDLKTKQVKQYLEAVKNQPELLDAAQPGDALSLAASITATSMLGTPGPTTPTALKAQAKTATTQAQTGVIQSASILDLVKEGVEGWRNAPQQARRAAGQQISTGMTQESTETKRLQDLLAIETSKEAIKFAASPSSHPWGKELRKLGIDPTAAMAAAGTGMISLMGSIAQMTAQREEIGLRMSLAQAEGNKALEVAREKLDDDWAKQLSAATGGKLPPSVIKATLQRRLAGLPPVKITSGPRAGQEAGIEAMMDEAAELAYRVSVTEAAQKGNPEFLKLQGLLSLKDVKDEGVRNTIADEIRKQAGITTATIHLGPRPMEGPAQAAWDMNAQPFINLAPRNQGFWANLGEKLNRLGTPAPRAAPNAVPGNLGVPAQQQKPATQPVGSIKDLTPEDQANLNLFLQAMQGAAPQR